jgi:spoIIIJ-associated protein
MSTNDSIEVSAATVEAAIEAALQQLGATQDNVEIEVLDAPRQGVLGVGARDARVRVTRRAPQAASSSVQSPPPRAPSATLEEQSSAATEILTRILELMGEQAQVGQLQADAESIELEIKGDGSGILIGRHGQTLDAMEYLVNRILARRIKDAVTITLETESYRARRRQQLHRMALQMGERAKRDHAPVKLEPMPPRDRRVIHLALKDDPMLTTRSEGEGFIRSIEIVPAGAGERPPRGGGRQQARGQRQKRPTEAIGEQGGFKHGQKRIV